MKKFRVLLLCVSFSTIFMGQGASAAAVGCSPTDKTFLDTFLFSYLTPASTYVAGVRQIACQQNPSSERCLRTGSMLIEMQHYRLILGAYQLPCSTFVNWASGIINGVNTL